VADYWIPRSTRQRVYANKKRCRSAWTYFGFYKNFWNVRFEFLMPVTVWDVTMCSLALEELAVSIIKTDRTPVWRQKAPLNLRHKYAEVQNRAFQNIWMGEAQIYIVGKFVLENGDNALLWTSGTFIPTYNAPYSTQCTFIWIPSMSIRSFSEFQEISVRVRRTVIEDTDFILMQNKLFTHTHIRNSRN